MSDPLDWVEPLLLGELDDEHVKALEQWLTEDASHRIAFLHEVQLCREIRRAFIASDSRDALDAEWDAGHSADDDESDVMRSVIDQALAMRRQHEVEEEANRKLAEQQAAEAQANRYKLRRHEATAKQRELVIPLPLLIAGMAAVLFLAVFLLLPDKPTQPGTTPNPMTQTPVQPRDGSNGSVAVFVQPVAQLRQTHAPRWGRGGIRPDREGQFVPGRYALESGAVELTMEQGAVLVIEGPAEFELTDAYTGRLLAGRLTVDSTDAGGGFRLQTPTAEVIDQGGRFGLAVNSTGQTRAHVYAGRIDFSNLQPTAASGRLALRANEGAVIDRPDAAPRRAPVAPEQFALEIASLSGKPVVTGEADYHNQMPASVVMNRGPQSPRAWVALESTGRRLQRGTAWAQGYPERPRMLTHPEGRVVDSYLVVFDPADETSRVKSCEFELTFPGEVLSVITEDDGLAESHEWYGDSTVQYVYQGLRTDGLEGAAGEDRPDTFVPDRIEMSDDQRTIRVRLDVQDGADVFRVLVVRPSRVGDAGPTHDGVRSTRRARVSTRSSMTTTSCSQRGALFHRGLSLQKSL